MAKRLTIAASIGLFFVPAAVLMTVAAAMPDPRPAFAPG